jgi:hypothetical protein
LARAITDEHIHELLCSIEDPVETDFSLRKSGGQIWALYKTVDAARRTIHTLHQKIVGGVCVSAKFELGLDKAGNRIVDRNSHHTVMRHIAYRKGVSTSNVPSAQEQSGVSYTHKSVFCGNIEYPFPSGLYLSRVINLSNIFPSSNVYLRIVTDHHHDAVLGGSKSAGYAKEVSEGMAMADATERAIRMVTGECHNVYACYRHSVGLRQGCDKQYTGSGGGSGGDSSGDDNGFVCRCNDTRSTDACGNGSGNDCMEPRAKAKRRGGRRVRVYVLGDGVTPLSAACIALHLHPYFNQSDSAGARWSIYSIDPLMQLSTSVSSSGGHVELVESNQQLQYTNALESAVPVVDAESSSSSGVEGNSSTASSVVVSDDVKFLLFRGYSQDFLLPSSDSDGGEDVLSIVVACHSHAPLQEFWDRVTGPRIAITMACCADYCHLDTSCTMMPAQSPPPLPTNSAHRPESLPESSSTVLLCEFDDFEVYSPKRHIKIFYSP